MSGEQPFTWELHTTSARELMASLAAAGRRFDLVHIDAPWLYSGGYNNTQRGLAGFHYEGMKDSEIVLDFALAGALAKPDTYCVLWMTFPKLWEFATALFAVAGTRKFPWTYVTGGTWGKIGRLGVGYHVRGDAEPLLIFKKGNPKPQENNQSNLWLDEDVPPAALWTAERGEHSVKPQTVLADLVNTLCPPGGTVLDLYAGESASLALACRRARPVRHYVGAEIDEKRAERARLVLAQPELELGPSDLYRPWSQAPFEFGDR